MNQQFFASVNVIAAMSKNIYKYVGPEYLDKVFGSPNIVTLKCGYPKDFNDPYELFLTIDFQTSPDVLAFYAEVVGELPQLPTTCFSISPIVIPMWAHYSQDMQGIAIEFNEAKLAQHFPKSGFGDVAYKADQTDDLTSLLYHAFHTCKFRHLYLLRQSVFSAAYYTKAEGWSYEQERRMIVRPSETRSVDNLSLIDVPGECITGLLCGPRASPDTKHMVRDKANQIGCDYFDLQTGKSSAVPFFVDSNGEPYIFGGTDIEPSPQSCLSCNEPLAVESEQCSWCEIDESHESEAREHNSFRMLEHFGLLDDYLEGMMDVDREHKI